MKTRRPLPANRRPKKQEREALEGSFQKYQFPVGERTWTRQDLHERPRPGPAKH